MGVVWVAGGPVFLGVPRISFDMGRIVFQTLLYCRVLKGEVAPRGGGVPGEI